MAEVTLAFEGLSEALAEIRDELRAIRAQLDALNGDVGFYDSKRAATYLSSTAQAVRAAAQRGHLTASRSATGRLLFSREALDAFANERNGA